MSTLECLRVLAMEPPQEGSELSFRVLLRGGGVHRLSGKELRRTNPLLLLDYYEGSMTVVAKQCCPREV